MIKRFVENPVAANLLMLSMLLLGFWASMRINVQFLPTYHIDIITVNTVWPGNSAEDIEKSITQPLEHVLKSVDRLKRITSTSRQNYSSITLEYEDSTDMLEALSKVQELIAQVSHLPKDSKAPVITRVEPFEQIARVVITGKTSLDTLRDLAFRVDRELSSLGISKITISGLPEQEIAILVDSDEIRRIRTPIERLANKVASTSSDVSAGMVGRDAFASPLRGNNQRQSARGFSELPLTLDHGSQLLTLEDIATVKRRNKIDEPMITYQDQPAIVLTLLRDENTHTLEAAKTIKKWLQNFEPSLDEHIEVFVFDEKWQQIKERLLVLLSNGLSGLLCIGLVLFLFLHHKVAIWAVIGIPTSVLAALACLYLTGYSIDMVSLFALIMTLGIIVDDTIVVGEEVLFQLQQKTPLKAVVDATQKMMPLIVTSSLTTICAFLPLFMILGVIGQILKAIPVVVICVIIASIVECFLVLPGHLYHSMQKPSKTFSFREKVDALIARVEKHYFHFAIVKVIRHRFTFLTAIVSMLIMAWAMIAGNHLRFDFFPSPEGRIVYADVTFISGLQQRHIDDFLKKVEHSAYEAAKEVLPTQKLIDHLFVHNNESAPGFGVSGRGQKIGTQYAAVVLELISPEERSVSNERFIKAWREKIALPPGVINFVVSAPQAGPPGKDIDIRISASNAATLAKAATDVSQALSQYEGVYNLINESNPIHPERMFYLTEAAKRFGLNEHAIGQQLRHGLQGRIVQVFHTSDEEIEVNMMLPDSDRFRVDILDNYPIVTPAGDIMPLQNLVTIKNTIKPDEYFHYDAVLNTNVIADLNKKVTNTSSILKRLQQEALPDIEKRYDVHFDFIGKAEEQQETLHDMALGAVLGVVMIYLLLSWVFASYIWPLIVMVTIPLSFPGVILGHWLIGHNITMLSLFGVFGLSGIVVNDAIVLLNEYRLQQQKLSPLQAILRSSKRRLKPVMLTSITTVVGLLPLLAETSSQAQFLIPMAASIAFGLCYSTVLILFFIPVCMLLIETTSWQQYVKDSYQALKMYLHHQKTQLN